MRGFDAPISNHYYFTKSCVCFHCCVQNGTEPNRIDAIVNGDAHRKREKATFVCKMIMAHCNMCVCGIVKVVGVWERA